MPAQSWKPDTADDDLDNLSDSRAGWIDELEADLGSAARARLVAACGGTSVTVPHPENVAKSVLVQEAGLEAMCWLAERFAGETFRVPNDGGIVRRLARQRREYVLARPDTAVRELALQLGISTERVKQIRREARKDGT